MHAPNPSSLSEWTAVPPAGITLAGFRFSYRTELFEWRTLTGIDPDAVVKLTDVRALEDCLHTLQQGSLTHEKSLSCKNCVQLFRCLQLANEYVWHLRNAHTKLLDVYAAALTAANRWQDGARQYLDAGNQLMSSCLAHGDINRDMLAGTDEAKSQLEVLDAQYNVALDALESSDTQARYFHFRKQRVDVNWQALCAVDVDHLTATNDTQPLDKVIHNLVFGCLGSEEQHALTPHHFQQLIPLAQCALDYMLFQANASGAAMERAMHALRAACTDIPHLTVNTQQLHTRITNFLLEAQHQAAHLTGSTSMPVMASRPMTASGQAPSGVWGPGMSVSGSPAGSLGPDPMLAGIQAARATGMQLQQQWSGSGYNPAPASYSMQAAYPLQQQRMVSAMHASEGPVSSMVLHPPAQGSLGMMDADPGKGTGSPTHRQVPPGAYLYRNYSGLTGSQSLGAQGGFIPAVWPGTNSLSQGPYAGMLGGPGAAHMQAYTAELHTRMEALECDLRQERSKTDEMKRLVADIRDRVVSAGAAAGGGWLSAQPSGDVWSVPSSRIPLPSMSGAGEGGAGVGTRPQPSRSARQQRPRGHHRPTLSQGAMSGEVAFGDVMDGLVGLSLDAGIAGMAQQAASQPQLLQQLPGAAGAPVLRAPTGSVQGAQLQHSNSERAFGARAPVAGRGRLGARGRAGASRGGGNGGAGSAMRRLSGDGPTGSGAGVGAGRVVFGDATQSPPMRSPQASNTSMFHSGDLE